MAYTETPEQTFAIHHFSQQIPTKVIAFAGAGKTSTLVGMAKQSNRTGLYIAFNKSIADEAGTKFPHSVKCTTAHSLAYRSLIRDYNKDKLTKGYRLEDLNPYIKAALPGSTDAKGLAVIRATVPMALRRFGQSWDDEIGAHHVPKVDGVDAEQQASLGRLVPDIARRLWADMINPRHAFPLGFDGYLKLWALRKPKLRHDFLMVDEAQDLNPVLIGVVRAQLAQVVSVGDSHQQIYEWRGARDALQILPGTEARLTQSFRFGEEIAAAADKILIAMGEVHPLRGNPAVEDAVHLDTAEPAGIDAVLCRSNAGVIGQAIDYLDAGRAVYVPGGVGELRGLVEDALRLMNGQPARSAGLVGFAGWQAVKEFSQTEEGRELRTLVSLVERFGAQRLGEVLHRISATPRPGSVTVSTAHKAKGMEWGSVRINEDFWVEKASLAEKRLFYVAITRAKRALYVSKELLAVYGTAGEAAV